MLKDHLHRTKGLLLLLVGSACFLIGALVLVQDLGFLRRAVHGQATILEASLSADKKKGYLWDLRLRYWLPDKGVIEAKTQSSSSTGFEAGKNLPILYDPSDPIKVRVEDDMELWGPSLILMALGGAVLWYVL